MSASWNFRDDEEPLAKMGDCAYMLKWGWFYAGAVALGFSLFFTGVPRRLMSGLRKRGTFGGHTGNRAGRLGSKQMRTALQMTTFFVLIITIFGGGTCLNTGNARDTAHDVINVKQPRWTHD